METDLGQKISGLKVDGGVTKSDFIMQQQADILGQIIEKSEMSELTAFGAAMAAGLGVGLWPSMSDIPLGQDVKPKKFVPTIPLKEADLKYNHWLNVLQREMKTD